MSGNLETKYKVKELGLTFTEKWNTDNTLNTTVDIQDKLLPGLKVSLSSRNLFYIFGLVFTKWPDQFFYYFIGYHIIAVAGIQKNNFAVMVKGTFLV